MCAATAAAVAAAASVYFLADPLAVPLSLSRTCPQMRFADKCVTTPEVLREVRDKQSRAALEALPFTIETHEPGPDAVKAGKQAQ